jgi:protein-S-isoprenylcysteine O-methyltransferase Ste14
MKYIILSILWILWCFLHSFFTSTCITSWFKTRLGDRFALYRISYNLLSAVTLLPLLYWQGTIPGPVVIKLSPFLMIFKYAALVLGAVIVAGSFLSFDVWEFAGIRKRKNSGGTIKTEPAPVISKHGFYGIVRHPMYLGGFVFLIALMMNAFLASFIGFGILAVYMIIGTFHEDRRLAKELGKAYRDYQREVPMLFPNFLRGKEKNN